MARNPKKPSDNYIFSSEENLEKQAELMEKLADKVARNMERKFESVAKRLSESQEKEFNKCDIMKSKLKRNVTSSSSFGYKKNQICITEDPEVKMKKLRRAKNSMSKSMNEKNGMSDDNNTQ